MAPGYRATAANTRRGNRSGFAEHDDFEGANGPTPSRTPPPRSRDRRIEIAQGDGDRLPVRQWRKQIVTVAPPPEREENKKQDRWAEELPHGMPRDTHLLTPHNQQLLRLARSGKLYRKRPLLEEDDPDPDGMSADKQEKKDTAASEGYALQVSKWVRLDRSAEDAGVNCLAKRQKGTITLHSRLPGAQASGPTITKATVKRIDAAGNPYTQEVTLHDGQPVDGEIISTSLVAAPDAIREAAPMVATPMRRKPPVPQKKKGRGRGRGRGRTKLPLPASTRPIPQGRAIEVKFSTLGPTGVKIEPEDAVRIGGDGEANESSALDEDDGEEGSGDDEEGDGDDSGTPADRDDYEMKDARSTPPPDPTTHVVTTSTNVEQAPSNLAPRPLSDDPSRFEGSPLKNVTLRSPTDTSPHLSPTSAAAPGKMVTFLSEVSVKSAPGLQASPTESQRHPLVFPDIMRDAPVDTQLTELPTQPFADTASEEASRVSSTTLNTQPTTGLAVPTSDQFVVPPIEVERARPAAEPSSAPIMPNTIQLSTETPMSGPVLEPAKHPAPVATEALVEQASVEQTPPDEGTEDGVFDILGSLSTRLKQQAEEDTSLVVAAPDTAATLPTNAETGAEGNEGGDV